MPKITVAIPVHNTGEYLGQCIESVLCQTLEDIELVCIDDASSDDSLAILKEYEKEDPRVTVISNGEGMGAAASRNKAIKQAGGEYMAFLDSDDWYPDPSSLEKLYNAATENGVDICGGSLTEYDSNTGEVVSDYSGRGHLEIYQFLTEGLVDYADWQGDFGWIRFIYKVSFLRSNSIEFPILTRYEDPVFFVRAMCAAKRFYAIPDAVYRYRIFHKTMELSDKNIDDAIKGMAICLAIAQEKGYNKLYEWTVESLKWHLTLSPAFREMQKKTQACERREQECRERIAHLDDEKSKLQEHVDELSGLLNELLNSQAYKLGQKIAGPYNALSSKRKPKAGE